MEMPSGEHAPGRGASARGASKGAFVTATQELLRRRGYAASGLGEIVARSGAPKGSLYFHFPGGKQELAVTAMERSAAQLRDAMAAILDSSDDVNEAIGRLIDALAAGLARSDFADGCPIATVALETAGESEVMRVAAQAAFDSWLEVLEERLTREGVDRALAQQRAMLVLAAIEGGLILARARHDVTPLLAVSSQLRSL
jgi:TetR/AcrR family transcriptional regulator, lmrAB and yxaGH operons repressor